MNKIDYFLEAFHGMDRLGPGSVETTLHACSFVPDKASIRNIIDVGCGNGGQTITLANEFIYSSICGVDVDEYQIDRFRQRINNMNLATRVSVINASMINMPFDKKSVDLIWAEGSIYIIGFKNGLRLWKKYLKDNGIIACSEVSWLCEPDKEVYDYWKQNYPNIDSVENNVKKIAECGYRLISYFAIPSTNWIDNFYVPLETNLKRLEEAYPGEAEVIEMVGKLRYEMKLFEKFKHQYNYVFYIMQKN